MAENKSYLAEAHREVYSGTADLYVYFYRQGGTPQSRCSHVLHCNQQVAASGLWQAIRGYFAAKADIVSILDFGHAPIFPDADTFPCIVVVRRKFADDERVADHQTQISLFHENSLERSSLTVSCKPLVMRSRRIGLVRINGAWNDRKLMI